MNNRSGLSNSGDMTVIRLERSDYSTLDDISGTVELSNAQRKEITGIVLELATWRHIALPTKDKTSVEQVWEPASASTMTVQLTFVARQADTRTLPKFICRTR